MQADGGGASGMNCEDIQLHAYMSEKQGGSGGQVVNKWWAGGLVL